MRLIPKHILVMLMDVALPRSSHLAQNISSAAASAAVIAAAPQSLQRPVVADVRHNMMHNRRPSPYRIG